MERFRSADNKVEIFHGDFLQCYQSWPTPVAIISDGPYGINGFPGDLKSPQGLEDWYEPFVNAWSEVSTPQTTLWFWNTELGWANVHQMLVRNGWDFVNCHTWDKGLSHIAGNVNTKTIRKFPVTTEVCVQYVKRPEFFVEGKKLSMQDWLRYEWKRTGLSFSKTNEACEVKNAATRKYFTNCHLWYFPPADAFEKFSRYANKHGKPTSQPYFSINGQVPSREQWENMRATFNCQHGITNVWRESQLKGEERIKEGSKAVHYNQKPLKLYQRIIEACTNDGDVIWEPFGGLCPGAIVAAKSNRSCFSAEITAEVYDEAIKRFKSVYQQRRQLDLVLG